MKNKWPYKAFVLVTYCNERLILVIFPSHVSKSFCLL